MEPSRTPVIWLAYVSYPVTTAAYFERALRRSCRVITCGPKIGPEIIQQWQLQNMKLPVLDHDLPLPARPNMREVTAAVREKFLAPDLYLWIESVHGYYPAWLDGLSCPKACYMIDSHLNLQWHVEWAKHFDFVFVAQREYLPEFRRHGSRNVFWLPLAGDPEIHSRKTTEKKYDIGFAGGIFAESRRAALLERLGNKAFLLKAERCFWDDMALLFSQSRMVFNNAVRNDLNMRVFEAMSTGTFLLTDLPANSGQDELFVDGEDLGIYEDKNLLERARYYLIREEEREQIAQRAQTMVHQAHTYAHRCAELMKVCLAGQPSTPSAGEWRERSLAGLGPASKWRPKPPKPPEGRSFIIPVVDASEEGRRELGSLLDDLKSISGEVIVIFNSPEAAAAFKDDPRIHLSASLNVNVGVSRAWNLGVHLATQPTLFILNADLRIDLASIEALHGALWELPGAAVVGPEGSFFGFYTYEDILWFHKASGIKTPQLVDAVSGFFFATKRDLFARKILQFEEEYTPCFTEEWDLGLQARQAGYRCYIIPLKGYSHEWGVSAKPDKVIRYYDKQASVREILARNRIHFWRKWLSTAGVLALPPREPNGPVERPGSGAALLQSHVVELTRKGENAQPPVEIRTIEHRDLFPQILNFLGLTGAGAEVGVQTGLYSETLLKHWHGKRLYSIDPWREWDRTTYRDPSNVAQAKQEELFLETRQRLTPFQERSVIVRKTSAEAAQDFPDRSLDFVYLDAQHQYEAIREDIALWRPKVKSGGILAGHDFTEEPDERICGVKRAVVEFVCEHRLRELIITSRGCSWFVRIP